MLQLRSFAFALGGLAVSLFASPALATSLELVSKGDPAFISATGGGPSLNLAGTTSLSADGRYALFVSAAPNLVAGQVDVNGNFDVFLYDRVAGTITLVTRAAGTPARTGDNAVFGEPVLSADGGWVAVSSYASDLVPGGVADYQYPNLYLWERATGAMTLVSHAAGKSGPANERSILPRVSGDGGVVAFLSRATDLVSGVTDTNGGYDVFVYRRATGTVSLITHAAGLPTQTGDAGCEDQSLALSEDGRYLAFACHATNLVVGQTDANGGQDLFLHDLQTGTTILVSRPFGPTGNTTANGFSRFPLLSADGAYLAYTSTASDLVEAQDDSGGELDVFLYERTTGKNTLVSHASGGESVGGNAESLVTALSANGSFVVFTSAATDLVAGGGGTPLHTNVFLWERSTGAITLASRAGSPAVGGDANSDVGTVSEDGNLVAFMSFASDLVTGQVDPGTPEPDSDVFLFDRTTGQTTLVSHVLGKPAGAVGSYSQLPALTRDGRYTVWSSRSTEVTADVDSNLIDDVYLFDRTTGGNLLISHRSPSMPSLAAQYGGLFNAFPERAAVAGAPVSADGRFVVFVSTDPHVIPGQVNGEHEHRSAAAKDGGALEGGGQVFLYDRLSGVTILVSRNHHSAVTVADGLSIRPQISADGRYVVFESLAHDLVHEEHRDFFPAHESPEGVRQVFLFERETGEVTLVSRAANHETVGGNADSIEPVVSADGRFVLFQSAATDLLPGFTDGNGAGDDVFLYDRATAALTLVSRAAGSPSTSGNGGSRLPVLSADGRFTAFASASTNLVAGGSDTNGGTDVFLYDHANGAVTLLSRAAGTAATAAHGASTLPSLSADGSTVAFLSLAGNLQPGAPVPPTALQLVLADRITGEVTLASHAQSGPGTPSNGAAGHPVPSADGRFVAYLSTATDLTPGPVGAGGAQLYLYDRASGGNVLVSHAAGNPQIGGSAPAGAPSISADGRHLVYVSRATDLVPGQVDPPAVLADDVFAYDRKTGTNRLVSHQAGDESRAGSGESFLPTVSGDGTSIVFASFSQDLLEGDRNLTYDIYLERPTEHAGAFFTLPPCRLVDTRQPSLPVATGQPEAWSVYARCGVPSTAKAVSVNVTVIAGDAGGFLTLFPGDQPQPATSTLNLRAGQVRANNAVARLAHDGSGLLGVAVSFGGSGTAHVVLDVNGYFE